MVAPSYKFIEPAIRQILREMIEDDSSNAAGWLLKGNKVSRTTTAQVLLTLVKCINLPSEQTREAHDKIIKSFNYLKNAITGTRGDGEISVFVFTLLAHLQYHSRFADQIPLDPEIITVCVNRIQEKKFTNSSQERGYEFQNENENAPFFSTYLALEAYLHLYSLPTTIKETIIKGIISPDQLREEIQTCFRFITKKFERTIKERTAFDELALYYSIGIQCSYYQSEFATAHGKSEEAFCLENCIDYFTANIDIVKQRWCIPVPETNFYLLYISNLISGLLLYRDTNELSEKGLKLLYTLSDFILNGQLQVKSGNGIKKTSVDIRGKVVEPMWAIAHSLNTIIKIGRSEEEIKLILKSLNNEVAEIVEPEQSHFKEKTLSTVFYTAVTSGVFHALWLHRLFEARLPQIFRKEVMWFPLIVGGVLLITLLSNYLIVKISALILNRLPERDANNALFTTRVISGLTVLICVPIIVLINNFALPTQKFELYLTVTLALIGIQAGIWSNYYSKEKK